MASLPCAGPARVRDRADADPTLVMQTTKSRVAQSSNVEMGRKRKLGRVVARYKNSKMPVRNAPRTPVRRHRRDSGGSTDRRCRNRPVQLPRSSWPSSHLLRYRSEFGAYYGPPGPTCFACRVDPPGCHRSVRCRSSSDNAPRPPGRSSNPVASVRSLRQNPRPAEFLRLTRRDLRLSAGVPHTMRSGVDSCTAHRATTTRWD
jgi:hypothetical protein